MDSEIVRFVFVPMKNGINQVFVGIMVVLFLCDLITHYRSKLHHVDFKGVITVTGILGTFVGVLYGLNKFEIKDPTGSLPSLLEGLKIAFFTSVFGMSLSVLLGVMHIYARRKEKRLPEILSELPQQIRDGAIERIVTELNKVVQDFNNKLNEQFGENFKQLNEACKELVKWQVEHVKVLDKTQEVIGNSNTVIEKSEKVLKDVADRYEEIKTIIETLNKQTGQLDNRIEKFDTLFTSTQEHLDKIAETLDGVSSSLSEYTKEIKDDLEEIISSTKQAGTDSQKTVTSQLQQMQKIQQDLDTALKNMESNFVKITKGLAESFESYKSGMEEMLRVFQVHKQQKESQNMSIEDE